MRYLSRINKLFLSGLHSISSNAHEQRDLPALLIGRSFLV
jgi:hypothetical protein